MCIHTYCTFHPKPGHVSAIRKGRNIHLLQAAQWQKCLLNSMSHFPVILRSLLWPCLSLKSSIFLLWLYFLITEMVSITFAFSTLLNAVRFLGLVSITCTPQSPLHQKDIRNLKYGAEFLLARYCPFF